MRKFLLLSVLVCAVSSVAMAWGDVGHNVIVAIAQNHLTPRAKENIRKYIQYDLVKDSRYMDRHRKDADLQYAYHFHEQCINLETLEYDPNAQVEKGDLMRALFLSDYNLSHREQVSDSIVVLHIRMLIHFIGDLHCPVHLGIPSCWFPKPPYRQDVGKWYYEGKPYKSLHSFIDRAPALLYPGLGEYEIAERLDKVTRKQAREWVKGDFVDWTNDAAKTGFRIYEKQKPVWEVPDTPEPKYLPEGYLEDIRDTVNEELLKGGYRLAFLLNKYF